MGFSKDFLWGAAAASAQIEGGWKDGGRTPSIWDMATKKQVKHGETCHTACDHYHRWKEDVALMKEMGLKSYRFSISWSRVIPEEGKVNPEGLKFYSDLVDELIANGHRAAGDDFPLGSAHVGLQKRRLGCRRASSRCSGSIPRWWWKRCPTG